MTSVPIKRLAKEHLMRWPLRYQILLPFGGAMLAVVVGVSLIDAYLAARRTGQRIERQLSEVAQTLQDATFPLTDAVLRQTRGLSGAELLLTDTAGQLRAASLPRHEIATTPPGAPSPRFVLGNAIEFAGSRYLHTAIKVGDRGGQSGLVLHILYPERFLQEARWQAAYPPLIVGTALLGVVIALAIAIAGRLTRPILELRRRLSRLVEGDFRPVPLPDRDDEIRDLVGSVNALGDQLEELRRVVKRSERMALLGQLSGGLAHQLRNSVTGARLAVQLHQRHCREIDQDSLAVTLRQLSITESQLGRFLTVGQPSAPRWADCDLTQCVLDVAALVGPACQHRGVTLAVTAPGDSDQTPPHAARQPIELHADADQLRQLFLNLVLNGIEAAGSSGWVHVELVANEGEARVRVLDSGPGLSDSLVERLFEPFASDKPEGIGLGLSVAKTIAESHGGAIRYLPSRPTTFEVTLPRQVPAKADQPVVARPQRPSIAAAAVNDVARASLP
jgi:signal transduction histidine kinase